MSGPPQAHPNEANAPNDGDNAAPAPLPMVCRVFIPPGKTLDISKWDCMDVELWTTCFLRPPERVDGFDLCQKYKIDGDCLMYILKNGFGDYILDPNYVLEIERVRHPIFELRFREEVWTKIVKHAQVVHIAYVQEEERKREEAIIKIE